MFTHKFSVILRNYSSTITRLPRNDLLFNHMKGNVARLICMSAGDTKDVTYEEVRSLKDDDKVYLIDVREPNELKETGSIPGSINIPLNEVESTLSSLSSNKFMEKYQRSKPNLETPLVFSCKMGTRSAKALNIARTLGFKHVHNYKGGWVDWEKNTKKA